MVKGSVPSRTAGDHAAGTWLGCCHAGGPGTTWHGSEVGRGQSREHPHLGQMDGARGETLREERWPRGPSDCPGATVAALPRLQDLSSSPGASLVDLTQEVSVGRGQREPRKTAPSPGDEALGRSDGCGPPTQSGCDGGGLKQMVLSPPQKIAASLRSLGNWPWRSWTAAPAQTGGPRAGEVTSPVGPCAAAGTERDTGESWRHPSPGGWGAIDLTGAQVMGLRQRRGAPPAVFTPCGVSVQVLTLHKGACGQVPPAAAEGSRLWLARGRGAAGRGDRDSESGSHAGFGAQSPGCQHCPPVRPPVTVHLAAGSAERVPSSLSREAQGCRTSRG